MHNAMWKPDQASSMFLESAAAASASASLSASLVCLTLSFQLTAQAPLPETEAGLDLHNSLLLPTVMLVSALANASRDRVLGPYRAFTSSYLMTGKIFSR